MISRNELTRSPIAREPITCWLAQIVLSPNWQSLHLEQPRIKGDDAIPTLDGPAIWPRLDDDAREFMAKDDGQLDIRVRAKPCMTIRATNPAGFDLDKRSAWQTFWLGAILYSQTT